MDADLIINYCDKAGIVQQGGDLNVAQFSGGFDEIRSLVLFAMNEAFRQSAQIAFQMGWDHCNNNEYQCACAEIEDAIRNLSEKAQLDQTPDSPSE